ncbi:linear amide C-N hydrolase [Algisphaera agarilytica]|uniref:Choloylglycine hydrolase n=1 Tax=Algisphaera agarilytica TaxID=1385975 RepID=A0A7X0H750_9BACT|nr:choloylglycine hydrolase family protein [Algisphaera agarilytica]MBB6430297.1 choloylglycine hydrolase [Algisphaera agarilytica]
MGTKRILLTLAAMMLIPLGFRPAEACTGIMLVGEDGTIVRARTVEWGPFDLQPTLDVVPRGYEYDAGEMPDGKNGMKWKGKYGVVGTAMLGHATPGDGMNEVGLTAGLFYLPGFTTYEEYKPEDADRSIAGIHLAGYVLSMFETVDEVREGLKDVRVVAVDDPKLGFPFPLHMLVADARGGRIVVEYIDGKATVFEADLGTITNSPTYDWHMTNLNNYINLSAISIPEREVGGVTFGPLGAGSGMIGLPGDFTPPSRFVRAVAFSQSARPTVGDYDTVREAFRILDNFNIPLGAAEGDDDDVEAPDLLYSATQWTTAADIKNMKFYYHTQFDRAVHMADLNQIDFDTLDEISRTPMNEPVDEIIDVTPKK